MEAYSRPEGPTRAAAGAQLTEIKVRGYHLDFYGHVNNARYLELLEEARWQWLEHRIDLAAMKEAGQGFSVVNININYRRPALLGHVLAITTSLKSLGARSGVISQVVRLKGTDTIVADAGVTFVIVSAETGRALPMAGALGQLFGG